MLGMVDGALFLWGGTSLVVFSTRMSPMLDYWIWGVVLERTWREGLGLGRCFRGWTGLVVLGVGEPFRHEVMRYARAVSLAAGRGGL